MRLDKYLKEARIIKRRTVANELCDQGRVAVNGREARASLEVKVGDTILVNFGARVLEVRVTLADLPFKRDGEAPYELLRNEAKA